MRKNIDLSKAGKKRQSITTKTKQNDTRTNDTSSNE